MFPELVGRKIHQYKLRKVHQEYFDHVIILGKGPDFKYDPKSLVEPNANFALYYRSKVYNHRGLKNRMMNPYGMSVGYKSYPFCMISKFNYINCHINWTTRELPESEWILTPIYSTDMDGNPKRTECYQKSINIAGGLKLPKRYVYSCGY